MNNLDELARQINQAHARFERGVRTSLSAAVEAGGLLAEAKVWIKHGLWLAWISENLSFSPRTAQKYMRLAAKAPETAHLDTPAGIEEALALIADPNTGQDLPEAAEALTGDILNLLGQAEADVIARAEQRRGREARVRQENKLERKIATVLRIARWFRESLGLADAADQLEQAVALARGREKAAA